MSKTASTSTLRPASTVVVMRDAAGPPEIFMVRRHEGTAFMGGAYVFPGGRVDERDREWNEKVALPRPLPGLGAAESAAFFVAAARELFEEAGVLLARDEAGAFLSLSDPAAHQQFTRYRADVHRDAAAFPAILQRERLRLAFDALIPFAHWVTPPVDRRRFDTRFFITPVPPHQVPAHDETETTASTWMTARDALERCRRDEIVLPPPTWTTLRELEPFDSVDRAIAWARGRPIYRREPLFREADDAKMLLLPGDPLNPEQPLEAPPQETRFILTNGRWRAEAART